MNANMNSNQEVLSFAPGDNGGIMGKEIGEPKACAAPSTPSSSLKKRITWATPQRILRDQPPLHLYHRHRLQQQQQERHQQKYHHNQKQPYQRSQSLVLNEEQFSRWIKGGSSSLSDERQSISTPSSKSASPSLTPKHSRSVLTPSRSRSCISNHTPPRHQNTPLKMRKTPPAMPPDLLQLAIMEHAISLGMSINNSKNMGSDEPNLDDDSSLLWIAEQSLFATVPAPWIQLVTDTGQVYFWNEETGRSSWNHPSDEDFRRLYLKEKQKKQGQIPSNYDEEDEDSGGGDLDDIKSLESMSFGSPSSTTSNKVSGEKSHSQQTRQRSTSSDSNDDNTAAFSDKQFVAGCRRDKRRWNKILEALKDALQKTADGVSSHTGLSIDSCQENDSNNTVQMRDSQTRVELLVEEVNHLLGTFSRTKVISKVQLDELEETTSQKKTLEMEMSNMRTKMEELQLKVSDYEQDATKKDASIHSLKQKLEDAETLLESKCNHIAASETRVNELEKKAAILERELASVDVWKEDELNKYELLEKELRNSVADRDDAVLRALDSQREVELLRAQLHTTAEDLKAVKALSIGHSENATCWKERASAEKLKREECLRKLLDLQGNIRVICRVRPIPIKCDDTGGKLETVCPDFMRIDDTSIVLNNHEFEFDRVFPHDALQGNVFSEIEDAVGMCMNGHRVSILAYGVTASGKTYTMEGTKDNRGVNYRAVSSLFKRASESKEKSYEFRISCLEIYNEHVVDLCRANNSDAASNLEIRMGKSEVYVEGLSEMTVTCLESVEKVLFNARNNRSTANNSINDRSSRSHSVVIIKVQTRENGRIIDSGRLNLIDLAGSERLGNTMADGQRLLEAQNINRSLSALCDVISSLGKKKQHIPYRNSKLTFLLQDSLKANSKVLMFVNVNPAPESANESLCSLKFAERCRAVQLGRSRRSTVI